MARYPSLSVCMIVKNEERNLPRLLSSIRDLADEVIVVDTGSTDATVEIAESHGAKVSRFAWCDDFSAARNESLKRATKDYILWLDGDDEVPRKEHLKIKEHAKKHFGSAVYLKLRNTHSTEETEAIQLRMFPNHRGVRFAGRVHEQVFFSLHEKGIPFTGCDGTILHHGYESNEDTAGKLMRNRAIHEKELEEDPGNLFTHFFLARTLRGLGSYDEALGHYIVFIDGAKERPEVAGLDAYKIALFEAAGMYVCLQKIDDAVALLESSRSLFPAFKLFGFSLGEIYFQLKDYEKAYDALLPLRGYRFNSECLPVDVRKSDESLNKCLGISALFTRDYPVATDYLERLVASEPENGEYYHYLSLAYEKAGNLNKAAQICEKGMELLDDDGSLRKRHFLLCVKEGNYERALHELEGLNGNRSDLDVLAAVFSIFCKTLNLTGIIHYYGLLQDELLLAAEPFPEGFEKVKAALAMREEGPAAEFFDGSIASLLAAGASKT